MLASGSRRGVELAVSQWVRMRCADGARLRQFQPVFSPGRRADGALNPAGRYNGVSGEGRDICAYERQIPHRTQSVGGAVNTARGA